MDILVLLFTLCLFGAGIISIIVVKRGYRMAVRREEKRLEAERQALLAERRMAQRRRKVWQAIDGWYAAFQEKAKLQEQLSVEKKPAELKNPFHTLSTSQIDAAFEQFTENKSQKTR